MQEELVSLIVADVVSYVKHISEMDKRDAWEEVVDTTKRNTLTRKIIQLQSKGEYDILEKAMRNMQATQAAEDICDIDSDIERLVKAIELKLQYMDELTDKQFINAVGTKNKLLAIGALRCMGC